jgi:hypothetical protein
MCSVVTMACLLQEGWQFTQSGKGWSSATAADKSDDLLDGCAARQPLHAGSVGYHRRSKLILVEECPSVIISTSFM